MEILREVGAWLNVNGEAIYNTRAAFYVRDDLPTHGLSGAQSHVYTTAKEGKLYINVMPSYTASTLSLPAMTNVITNAKILNNNLPINDKIWVVGNQMFIDLTNIPRDPLATVLEISVEGGIPRPTKNDTQATKKDNLNVNDIENQNFVALRNALFYAEVRIGNPLGSAEFGIDYPTEKWNVYTNVYKAALEMLDKQTQTPQPTQEEVNNVRIVLLDALEALLNIKK